MTIYGWDASHHDWGRGPMDIAAAKRDGIQFMTHKAGEGKSFTDDRFDDFYRRARSAGVPLLGAYYVNHPGDQNTQADRFLALLDAKAPGWRDGPFLLQVDAERFDYMDRAPNLTEIKAFCARLVSKTGGKFRPIVYAPKWLYGGKLAGLGYPLWASAYGTNPAERYRSAYPGDGSSRWAAYSGQTPAILQYGSRTRIGSQSTCDANAYRGTLDQLRALVYPGGGKDNDMDQTQNAHLVALAWRAEAMMAGRDSIAGGPTKGEAVWIVRAVKALATAVSAVDEDVAARLRTEFAAIDQAVADSRVAVGQAVEQATAAVLAALPEGDGPVSREDLVAALREVLGSLDDTPPADAPVEPS